MVGDVLGAGDVLDEVYVVRVVVVLVHALAGGPLPLELTPLRRAWKNGEGGDRAGSCATAGEKRHLIQRKAPISC